MHLSRFLSATTAVAALVVLAGLNGASAATARQAPESYVALGDSYSSGTGAGNYEGGSCQRSKNAYPKLWNAANSPASFDFTACSGARTNDVINGQLGPVHSGTTLISITVGGNDAGFADVMTTCVLRGERACLNRVDQARTYIANTLPGRLDAVYNAIAAKAPSAHVVVLGYPRMYHLNGNCSTGISEKSRAALNTAADDLNDVTAKRAADHGYTFGDVRTAFAGHEICSGDSWLHSVTWPLGDSYHPKAAGQSGGYLPVFRASVQG